MTTTNMFLNFGGKWDTPPIREFYFNFARLYHSIVTTMLRSAYGNNRMEPELNYYFLLISCSSEFFFLP